MYKPPRCNKCEYWRRLPITSGEIGECRYNTPQIDSKGYGYWPYTKSEDFCYKGNPIKSLLTEGDVAKMEKPPKPKPPENEKVSEGLFINAPIPPIIPPKRYE